MITLARSAPEKPGVRRAMTDRSASAPIFTLRAWTLRISSRPLRWGKGMATCRSKRPGRSRAGSMTSGRLVAAMSTMPWFCSKPSSSMRSWFKVCSRSSCPPPMPAKRWRPTASSSSTKITAGAAFLAWSKRSRTREAPTPTNISTNSEAEAEKNGTPASPATARASSVLPVPGAPKSSTPRGILPPSFSNFSGLFRNSTISWSSSLGSSAAGHVRERGLLLLLVDAPRPAAPEGERLLAPHLDLADDEEPPEREKQQDPADVDQQARQPAAVRLALEILDLVGLQVLDQLVVGHGQGPEVLGLPVLLLDVPADEVGPHLDVRHQALAELGLEDGVGDLRLDLRALEVLEERDEQDESQDPYQQLLDVLIFHS